MNATGKHDPRDWENDDYLLELDFNDAETNRYARAHAGAIVVPLSDAMRREFPTAESIEKALQMILDIRKTLASGHNATGDAAG